MRQIFNFADGSVYEREMETGRFPAEKEMHIPFSWSDEGYPVAGRLSGVKLIREVAFKLVEYKEEPVTIIFKTAIYEEVTIIFKTAIYEEVE